MKKRLQLVMLGLIILTLNSYARSQSGIYLTAADYRDKKISFQSAGKIRPNNSLADMPYITVTREGKKQKLRKSEVFGYLDETNRLHRFYKNQDYPLAEAGAVYIYVRKERNSQDNKGFESVRHYYFSTSPDGAIDPLTLENLSNAYSGNDKFPGLIDEYFSNGNVDAYDKAHGMYKVNYVFAKAQK